MNTSVVLTILTPIVLAFVNAGVLYIISKMFRVNTMSYGKSLLTYVGATLITLAVFFAFAFFGLFAIGLLLGSVGGFIWFCRMLRYPHRTGWLKTISIYIVFSILALIISACLYLTVRFHLILSPFAIAGNAMAPSYPNGQFGIVNSLNRDFERGVVVVYTYPIAPNYYFVGRIVGLPGEEVEIRPDGYVYINGKRLSEQYLASSEVATHPDTMITLEANQYFILGDNRGISADSRERGPVPKESILGVFDPVSDR